MPLVFTPSSLSLSNMRVRSYESFCVLLMVGIFFLASCSHLSQKSANDVFQSENPTYTIVDSEPGEGWSDVVYYHFYYKKPDDPNIYEHVYCFEYRNNKWEITSRYDPKQVK